MKMPLLALSLALGIASASAQAPIDSKIEGAFGKKLGDTVLVGGETLAQGPEGLHYIVMFSPAEG